MEDRRPKLESQVKDCKVIQMANDLWVIIGLFSCLALMTTIFVVDAMTARAAENEACKDVGFTERGMNVAGISSCRDADRNLNFVDMQCTGWFWWTDCTAVPISVGGVWVSG